MRKILAINHRGLCGHHGQYRADQLFEHEFTWTDRGHKGKNAMTILDLAMQKGINPKRVAGTAGGEYHSSCPDCGGNDRFYIQPYRQMQFCMGYFRCRKCGISGDAIKFAQHFFNLSFTKAASEVKADIKNLSTFSTIQNTSYFKPVTLVNPPNLWIDNATEFVIHAHNNLLNNKEILNYLDSRGIPLTAVQRHKIGWSDINNFFHRSDWGLNEQIGKNGKPLSLWIPQGIIIPSLNYEGNVIRLKVRCSNYQNSSKYVAVSGSMNGLSFLRNKNRDVLIVVESELDAFAINAIAQDFASIVAVGSNIKNPDNVVDHFAKSANKLLICHDNDEGGAKMLAKWKKLYPSTIAYPTPIGKDIGEAIELGLNLYEWLLEIIN